MHLAWSTAFCTDSIRTRPRQRIGMIGAVADGVHVLIFGPQMLITTMPFEIVSPASRASSVFGTTPIPTSTRSAGKRTIAEDHPAHLPMIANNSACCDTERDLNALTRVNIAIKIGKDGRNHPRHQPGLDLQYAHRFPERRAAAASSRPMNPPPITTTSLRVFQTLLDVDRLHIGAQVADTIQLRALYGQCSIARPHREYQRLI